MNFFVTGGAGFIGSALVRELLAREHQVVVYDNFTRGSREFLPLVPRLQMIKGDVRDRVHVRGAVRASAPDHVVHLAALHFIPDCIERPAETLEINVGGTESVLAACAEGRVGSVILASSAAVYAPSDHACDEEHSALGYTDIYGESKTIVERLAGEHHATTRQATSSLRIFNAIGPRETNPHVVPHIFESLRQSDQLELGNTDARRDYVNTRDIAAAILGVAERSAGLQVYNVGSGLAHSVAAIVTLLSDKLARPLRVKVDRSRLRSVDRPLLLASTSKLEREIGFTPRITFSESLDELVAHYGLRNENQSTTARS